MRGYISTKSGLISKLGAEPDITVPCSADVERTQGPWQARKATLRVPPWATKWSRSDVTKGSRGVTIEIDLRGLSPLTREHCLLSGRHS